MFSIKTIAGSLTVLATLLAAQVAVADTIVVASPTTFAIAPSNDTLTLTTTNQTAVIGDMSSTVDFQLLNFNIQGSAIPDQLIAFTLNEDVTINGITQNVSFDFTNNVTAASDTLSVSQGQWMQFGGVSFRTLAVNFVGTNLGDNYITMQAEVLAVPEPESYAMILAGLALLGATMKRRKA